jgi:transposase
MVKYSKISPETRNRIVELLESETSSRKQVASVFGLPYSTVCRIYDEFCKSGEVKIPKRGGNKKRKLEEEDLEKLRAWIAKDCSITLEELKAKLADDCNKIVSVETVRRSLERFNFSVKRVKVTSEAADTPELWDRRREFAFWLASSDYANGNVIFVDETGFKMTMRRSRGRSERGVPARITVPRLRSKNVTVIAAISYNQLNHYKILEKNGDRVSFLMFLTELTARIPRQSTIVMDNVRFHRCHEIIDFLVRSGHQVKFLPPYSPYFNPIENFFSQWKALVRQIAPKSDQELLAAIQNIDTHINETMCNNYVRHAFQNALRCMNGDNNLN